MLADFKLVIRYSGLALRRRLLHLALRTVPGWMMIFGLLIASPSLAGLAFVGAYPDEFASTTVVTGALLVSHAIMFGGHLLLCYMAMLKQFIVKRKDDPLLYQPAAWDVLLLERLSGIALTSSLYWLISYYVFGLQWLLRIATPAAVATHFVLFLAFLLATVVFVAAVFRRTASAPFIQRHAQALMIPFFIVYTIVYGAGVGLPMMADWAPVARFYETFGGVHFAWLALLQFPYGVIAGSARGSVLASVIAVLMVLCWVAAAVRVYAATAGGFVNGFALDIASSISRRYRSAFSTLFGGASTASLLRFFVTKDFQLRYRGAPFAYVRDQVTALSPPISFVLALPLLGGFRDLSVDRSWFVVLALLIALAALAYLHGLSALGRERHLIAAIVPGVTPRRLVGIKLISTCGFAALHGLAYAALIVFAARVVGLRVDAAAPILAASPFLAVLVAALGTACGCLVPDFACRSVMNPGASRTGLVLFSIALMPTIGCAVVGTLLAGATPNSMVSFWVGLLLAFGIGSMAAASFTLLAVQRLVRHEV